MHVFDQTPFGVESNNNSLADRVVAICHTDQGSGSGSRCQALMSKHAEVSMLAAREVYKIGCRAKGMSPLYCVSVPRPQKEKENGITSQN